MTEAFREISLKLCTILSYRQAAETMNRLLHRNHQKEIRQKTYADFCIRTGKKLEEETNQKAERILLRNGFDGKSGKLIGKAAPEIKKDSKSLKPLSEELFQTW